MIEFFRADGLFCVARVKWTSGNLRELMVDSGSAPTDEHVLLVGQPPLQEFIRFIKTRSVDGCRVDEGSLVRDWREARDHLSGLATVEAGWADAPEDWPLPDSMKAIAEAAINDPTARRTLSYIPYRWCMVELDRLVVWQKSIDLAFVRELKSALGGTPTDADLIRLAVGHFLTPPPVRFAQLSDNVYSFSSPSADLRFLELVPLQPAEVAGHHPPGHATAVIGAFVGLGVNFSVALKVRNRLVLTNGSHRAYALRELGITRMPCLVGEVEREEELDLVAAPDLRQSSHLYLRAPRPPLFKDYFDTRLRRIVPVARTNRVVQIQFTVQQTRMPAV